MVEVGGVFWPSSGGPGVSIRAATVREWPSFSDADRSLTVAALIGGARSRASAWRRLDRAVVSG